MYGVVVLLWVGIARLASGGGRRREKERGGGGRRREEEGGGGRRRKEEGRESINTDNCEGVWDGRLSVRCEGVTLREKLYSSLLLSTMFLFLLWRLRYEGVRLRGMKDNRLSHPLHIVVTGDCEVFEWLEIVRYLSDWRLWGIWVAGDCEIFEWQEIVRYLSGWRLWGIWVAGDCEVFEWLEIVRYLSGRRLWGIWVTGDCEVFEHGGGGVFQTWLTSFFLLTFLNFSTSDS